MSHLIYYLALSRVNGLNTKADHSTCSFSASLSPRAALYVWERTLFDQSCHHRATNFLIHNSHCNNINATPAPKGTIKNSLHTIRDTMFNAKHNMTTDRYKGGSYCRTCYNDPCVCHVKSRMSRIASNTGLKAPEFVEYPRGGDSQEYCRTCLLPYPECCCGTRRSNNSVEHRSEKHDACCLSL